MSDTYVHGYHPREQERLHDQAGAPVDLLHSDTTYPGRSAVLEVGCGVGAQTVTLARRSPGAQFTSIDLSEESIGIARQAVDRAGLTNVSFHQANVFDLPFEPESFDHVFVCFVLEHLAQPLEALAYFHPISAAAQAAIDCLVKLQRAAGGNALIGREIYPLLVEAGFDGVRVFPRVVYVDSSRPDLVEGFTRRTFTAMIEGVREAAIAQGLIDAGTFDAGVRDLHRAAAPDGVFNYTFFKGVARKGDAPGSPDGRADRSLYSLASVDAGEDEPLDVLGESTQAAGQAT